MDDEKQEERTLPDVASLPTIEEMRGLIPNFTGGLSLKEYFEHEDFD